MKPTPVFAIKLAVCSFPVTFASSVYNNRTKAFLIQTGLLIIHSKTMRQLNATASLLIKKIYLSWDNLYRQGRREENSHLIHFEKGTAAKLFLPG